MKKIFTLVAAALCAMNMAAKDYTGTLSVSVNESQPTVMKNQNITVEKQADGKYHLSIKNFKFGVISVGTIDVKDMEVENEGGFELIQYESPITIQKNEDGSPAVMAGMTMGMNFAGLVNDNVLSMQMNIDASKLGQVIDVAFQSNGTQIPNSDFEEFHTAKAIVEYYDEPTEFTSQEPNHWHSFTTATGDLKNAVQINKQIDESTDVRPGSNGKKSAKITSAIVLGFQPANGTLTTGQLQAGGMSADDTKNCAFLDITNEAKDDNGDPFYTLLSTRPDSIKAWVKYIPGGEKADYEIKKGWVGTGEYSTTASVKAVITDGTRYQDPEDASVEYKNIVAVAKNTQIESKDGAWQEITVPFDYASYADNKAEAKAILVNFGTNAVPGCASANADKPDQLFVDDCELVYNCNLKSFKFKGTDVSFSAASDDEDYDGEGRIDNKAGEEINLNDIVAESDGAGAYITKKFEYNKDWDQWELHVYVTSADLSDSKDYCFTFLNPIKDPTTGINNAQSITLPNGVKAIYNAAGQQVQGLQKGQVYIVKYNNGETKKMIKK